METCSESISSFFDDSSHSESNAKEECCDGDDELTDVEGLARARPLFPRYNMARASRSPSMPSRQKNHLTALVENNLSWSHNGEFSVTNQKLAFRRQQTSGPSSPFNTYSVFSR